MNPTVSLALTAGMLAALNPCAFSLLPAYLGWFIRTDTNSRPATRALRAMRTAAAMTAGFLATFTVVGLVLNAVAARLGQRLPWVTITIGALVAVTGLVGVLGGIAPKLPIRPPSFTPRRHPVQVALFGVVYAVASLSCTIGPFLAVTSVATRDSAGAAVATYAAYGLGMGIIITVLSASVAATRRNPTLIARRVAPLLPRLGGLLMVAAGLYAVWYGRWELRVYAGDLRTDPIVRSVESIRLSLIDTIHRIGAERILVVTTVALIVVAVGARLDRTNRVTRAAANDRQEHIV